MTRPRPRRHFARFGPKLGRHKSLYTKHLWRLTVFHRYPPFRKKAFLQKTAEKPHFRWFGPPFKSPFTVPLTVDPILGGQFGPSGRLLLLAPPVGKAGFCAQPGGLQAVVAPAQDPRMGEAPARCSGLGGGGGRSQSPGHRTFFRINARVGSSFP